MTSAAPDNTAAWGALQTLSPGALRELGLCPWDAGGPWLFPAEWYTAIPTGFVVVNIEGLSERFRPGETDDEFCMGMLACGIGRRGDDGRPMPERWAAG